MKRLTFLVAILAAFIAAAVAAAAPAPKATGDYGYSYPPGDLGVQRHLTFNAIQSTTETCGTFWNVEGVTSISFLYLGVQYDHAASLTQNGQGVTGTGGYTGLPLPGGPTNTWMVNAGLGSRVVGNTLDLSINYTAPPDVVGIVLTMHGTIAANGSISGTFTQTGGVAGTFTVPAGSATATAIYCGKGTAYYTDENGLWYFMNVKAVSVDGDTAWYAAQIIASHPDLGYENSATNYLFVRVVDKGEPGIGNDLTGGDLMTPSAALAAVADRLTPSANVAINQGNIQVH